VSIRRQMLLVLGLATVLPLVAAVWVGFTYSRTRLHQRANETLTASARQVAFGIDGFVRNAVGDVRRNSLLPTFADYLTLPAGRRPELESVVNRLLRGSVASDPIYVTACGLLDRDGRVVADVDAQRLGQSEGEAPWFREAVRTKLPYHSAALEPSAVPGFWLSSPVRDSHDRIVGVLRLCYAPSVFQHLLEIGTAAADDDVIPVLLDAAYRSLVSTDPQLLQPPLNFDRSPEFVFPHDPRMPGTWVRWTAPARSAGGQPDRLAVIRLTELPWFVGCVQEGSAFTAAIREIWRAALLYTTLFVGLLIIGANLLAHRLSKPIRQLADTAQLVAQGDLTATVPVSGGGEVEQTARAFNHMTNRLQQSLSTLERQAAEARSSERRLRELVDVSPFGIAVMNAQGDFAQLNRKFIELFGYGSDELRTVDDWWPRAFPDPTYRAETQQGWAAARLAAEKRGVESQAFEATVTCKDGTRRMIEFRSKNVGDVLIVVCLDLTERRRAETALHTSEERYRLLLEHAPEAIVVFDVEGGRFVDCNPAATRLFGYTRADFLLRGPVDVSPALQPDGRSSAEGIGTHIGNALGGGRPVFEWTHCTRDGHPFPSEVRLLRLPDASGRRLVRGSILDISARKHSEDTLRASEERYRLLIENSTELVAQVDPNGNFIYVSPNHLTITGYHPEEMIGTCVFDYLHADDVAEVLDAFKAPGVEVVRQFRFRFKDG
jgi:PAS domain S-box-containing protein